MCDQWQGRVYEREGGGVVKGKIFIIIYHVGLMEVKVNNDVWYVHIEW